MRFALAAHDLAGLSAWFALGVERKGVSGAVGEAQTNASSSRQAHDPRIIDVSRQPVSADSQATTDNAGDQPSGRPRVWELPAQSASFQPLTYSGPSQSSATPRLLADTTARGTLLDTYA